VLKKNWLRDVVPTQSVHRSCSIEKDIKDGEMVGADDGAATGIVTLRQETSLAADSSRALRRRREDERDILLGRI